MFIETYDTTLRDGAQSAGIAFTEGDRIKIITALDALGISCIEAGNIDMGELPFIEHAASIVRFCKIYAFAATRRPDTHASEDERLTAFAASELDCITVYGKASSIHARDILHTTAAENLAMIADTVSFLHSHGKTVVFDAEHFFDGYATDPSYALEAVKTAYDAGASRVVLCDTNGGMLPDVCGLAVAAVRSKFPAVLVGIHTHNDMGMAEACAVSAVLSGASHIQGTFGGIGERCGNANLCTLIPLLQLKLGFSLIGVKLSQLTKTARAVSEYANLSFNEHAPFVGGYAFAHKAGTHIDAAIKESASAEHTSPELVGNNRSILVSGLAGRAAVVEKTAALTGLSYDKNAPGIAAALSAVKSAQNRGFSYENADASLALLILRSLGLHRDYFTLLKFKVNVDEKYGTEQSDITALVKVAVDGRTEVTAAEGDGPVHALDVALRQALTRFYPALSTVRLSDYKVRVINSGEATRSVVRVLVESTDGVSVWRTVGVSADIIDASQQALRDSLEYILHREDGLLSAK